MTISKKIKISILVALVILGFVVFWFRLPIWEKLVDGYRLLADREQIRNLIASYGTSAPPVFMLIQILQV
ncbi:MAG: hypothetical protein PVH44_12110, partial [Desulfobacterales bacterium]